MSTATAASKPQTEANAESLESKLDRYECYFETIDGFQRSIVDLDDQVTAAKVTVEELKVKLSEARDELKELESLREAAEKSLLRFLHPKNREDLPLFDQMDEADEEIHGEGAADWRTEPITVLRISPKSIELLNDAGILLVGQLQDKMLSGGGLWWQKIDGLTEGASAAIADGMSEFINNRTSPKVVRKKPRK